VNPLSGLKISIPQSHLRHHLLATIGYGGFGIYCSHRESKLIKLNQIEATMNVAGHQVKVRGQVQYFKFLPQMKPDVYYVGVKLDGDVDERKEWRTVVEAALQRGFLAKPLV
jgi:hypothetical protein